MHYTYVLNRKNGEWYIGYTDNLERRLKEHKKEYNCSLIYYEAYSTKEAALLRERRLKYYGSAWRGLLKRINA